MNLYYTDENNTLQPVWMGSYGIGPGRCMGAIVEQNHDEHGIIWPKNIAPYTVAIVLINNKDETAIDAAKALYDTLYANGIDCILDDRNERAGVKFKDMDLIGIPYRITIGKGIRNGMVEFKRRNESDHMDIALDDVVATIKNEL